MACPKKQTFMPDVPASLQMVCNTAKGGYCCPPSTRYPIAVANPWPCQDPDLACLQTHQDGWSQCTPCPPQLFDTIDLSFLDDPSQANHSLTSRPTLHAMLPDPPASDLSLLDMPGITQEDIIVAYDAMYGAGVASNGGGKNKKQTRPSKTTKSSKLGKPSKPTCPKPLEELDTKPDHVVRIVDNNKRFLRSFQGTLANLAVIFGKGSSWRDVKVAANGDCFFSAVARAVNSYPQRIFNSAVTVYGLRELVAESITPANWLARQIEYMRDEDPDAPLYGQAHNANELQTIVRSKQHYAVNEDIEVVAAFLRTANIILITVNKDFCGRLDPNNIGGGSVVQCFEAVPANPDAHFYVVLMHEKKRIEHFTLAVDSSKVLGKEWLKTVYPKGRWGSGIQGIYQWDELPEMLRQQYLQTCGTAFGAR